MDGVRKEELKGEVVRELQMGKGDEKRWMPSS